MQLTRMGRNWPLAAGLLACLVLFAPDSAQALQVHDTPAEGLYAHQLAHIYYVVSLICFAGYVRRTDFTIRSWWYLRLFCLLMVLWNLLALFDSLVAQGNTVYLIEHNTDVIRSADWVLELGPGAGEEGGSVIYTGTPEGMLEAPSSLTRHYL